MVERFDTNANTVIDTCLNQINVMQRAMQALTLDDPMDLSLNAGIVAICEDVTERLMGLQEAIGSEVLESLPGRP